MVQPVASASIDVTANITRLQKNLDKAEKRIKRLEGGARRSGRAITAQFRRNRIAVAAFAASVGFAAKTISDAGIKMQGLQRAFRAATGSAEGGAQAFAFARQESQRLGLDLVTASESFAKLSAAAKGTSIEGAQARNIFTAVSEASRVLTLSADDTRGAFRAIEQVISKGKVQAEELRGQLGERLPGAFQIAARSMNLTTKELDKMLALGKVTAEDLLPKFAEELRRTFGPEVESAANDAQAAYNRFGNAMFQLKTDIANSGVLELLTELAKWATSAATDLGVFLARVGVIDAKGFLALNVEIAETKDKIDDAKNSIDQFLQTPIESAELQEGIAAARAELAELEQQLAKLEEKKQRKLSGADASEAAAKARKLQEEAEKQAQQARLARVKEGLQKSSEIQLEAARNQAEQELAIKQEMEALALEGKRLSDQELIALAEQTAREKVMAEFAAEQAAKGEFGQALTPDDEIALLRALNDEKIEEYRRLTDQQLKIGEDFRKNELRGDKLVEAQKRSTFSTLTGLLSQFAGKSKAISLLLLAIDTKKALASNTIATNVAAAKAAEIYGPTPKGYAEVANMYRLGGIRAKLITAAGVASGISAVAGGGGAGGGGGGLAGTSTPFDEPIDEEERRDESRVQIIIQGDVNGFDDFAQSKIIPAIQAAVKDQDVVLIDAESRNAAEIVDAAERNV